MALSPERTRDLLAEVGQQVLGAMHATLPLGGSPPVVVTVGDEDGRETLGMVPLLDVRDRFSALRQAVAQTRADGFVFAYDGFVQSADKVQVEAVLLVLASRWEVTAYATPYRREAGRIVVLQRLNAPPDVATAYAAVFTDSPAP